jgi:hypothetical protein
VERLDVGLRIDREGLDAQFAAGPDDAEGDFAAVGDEDFLNHLVTMASHRVTRDCWTGPADGWELPVSPFSP